MIAGKREALTTGVEEPSALSTSPSPTTPPTQSLQNPEAHIGNADPRYRDSSALLCSDLASC